MIFIVGNPGTVVSGDFRQNNSNKHMSQNQKKLEYGKQSLEMHATVGKTSQRDIQSVTWQWWRQDQNQNRGTWKNLKKSTQRTKNKCKQHC